MNTRSFASFFVITWNRGLLRNRGTASRVRALMSSAPVSSAAMRVPTSGTTLKSSSSIYGSPLFWVSFRYGPSWLFGFRARTISDPGVQDLNTNGPAPTPTGLCPRPLPNLRAALGDMMLRYEPARFVKNGAYGSLNVNRTVRALSALTDWSGPNWFVLGDAVAGSIWRWNVNATAWASKGVPSENLRPGLS